MQHEQRGSSAPTAGPSCASDATAALFEAPSQSARGALVSWDGRAGFETNLPLFTFSRFPNAKRVDTLFPSTSAATSDTAAMQFSRALLFSCTYNNNRHTNTRRIHHTPRCSLCTCPRRIPHMCGVDYSRHRSTCRIFHKKVLCHRSWRRSRNRRRLHSTGLYRLRSTCTTKSRSYCIISPPLAGTPCSAHLSKHRK